MTKVALLSLCILLTSSSGWGMLNMKEEDDEEYASDNNNNNTYASDNNNDSLALSASSQGLNSLPLAPSEFSLPLVSLPLVSLPSYQATHVSPDEWDKVKGLIQEFLKIPADEKDKEERAEVCRGESETFATYYTLYKKLNESLKSAIKELKADPQKRKNFLNVFGQFVAAFENVYDVLNLFYQMKTSQAVEKTRILRENIFPIAQRTFSTFMQVYQKITPEPLHLLGPLRNGPEFLAVEHDGRTKHIFYRKYQDRFIVPFTVYPHSDAEDPPYETYLPYFKWDYESGQASQDAFLFILDNTHHPMMIDKPGILIHHDKAMGYGMTVHQGCSSSIPYTKTITHYVFDKHQKPALNEALDVLDEITKDVAKKFDTPTPLLTTPEIAQKNAAQQKERAEKIQALVPQLPHSFWRSTTRVRPILPQATTDALEIMCQTSLEGAQRVFIPFPQTPLEEMEQTYLYLLDLQEASQETGALPCQGSFLLQYIQEQVLPGASLEDAIEAYKSELLTEYEKEIRRQQEERSEMVSKGTHYSEEKQAKPPQQEKPHPQKKNKSKEMKQPPEKELDEASQKAQQRLKILKSLHQSGATKFRKFMQIVNIATQGLQDTGASITAGQNDSSHGKIKGKGLSVPFVRAHGNQKEKSVSASSQKRILTGLVNHLMQKVAQQKPSS